ncbi:hypothetical protein [Terribacillus saccharophilus]|uniref:hypothetical protein n=1 Tax=Terribacillus saccharophilus TaxID=361277 RepID=UPI003981E106
MKTLNRAKLHDEVIQYLLNNNYHYFKTPLYVLDKELNPLRNVIREYGNSSEEDYNLHWSAAYNTNPFYQELLKRFSNNIHNANFIFKAGDLIAVVDNIWHMIELKTTTNADNIYHFNFDSFAAYDSLPLETRQFIHILFYNSTTQSFFIGRYNDLKFKSTCYVYPEVSDQREDTIRGYSRFIDIERNHNPNVAKDIDKSQNAYLKIDLNEQIPGVLSSIPNHINKITALNHKLR